MSRDNEDPRYAVKGKYVINSTFSYKFSLIILNSLLLVCYLLYSYILVLL